MSWRNQQDRTINIEVSVLFIMILKLACHVSSLSMDVPITIHQTSSNVNISANILSNEIKLGMSRSVAGRKLTAMMQ
ncbi:hypothetical protein QVD17_39444 [Tagetes erecta]|uniref:Uncharacterized protein n=1 Tax=Tagetes erecta TaxID=13708 RepID=A0AAD8JSA8_TARER|nr:hypothetical protein QVD17_39444 [Tagetes erecta]